MHALRSDRRVWLWVGSLLLLLLTAGQCGGAINSSPVASAGPDQSVILGNSVTLDGSASSDPDGDALTFGWSIESIPAGSAATLASAETPTASFTADVVGEYVLSLTVSDGVLDASDSVSVIASAENIAPVIAPIENRTMFAGDTIDVPFTFTDENPDSATVEATSNDQTLVADSGIQIVGPGADRVLRIATAPLETGIAVITVVVRDSAGLEHTESFGLTVIQPFDTQSKLTAADAASGDDFGRSVAISGDHAIIGAPLDFVDGTSSGSAYVFRRSGDEWVQSTKLPPAPLVAASTTNALSAGDEFGVSVAISGDYAIVGAHFDDERGTDSGAAYVYERCDSSFSLCERPWLEVVKLTARNAAADDRFGSSVAISGDYAVVGAFRDGLGTAQGSAYVFKRSGDDWVEISRLIASDAPAGEDFGGSVAIGGDIAIVGSYRDDLVSGDEGSAYVFQRSGNDWVEIDKLTASDGAGGDLFGFAVAISGDYAIISAVDGHSAYVFQRVGDDWVEIDKLTASVPISRQSFGHSVAISGDYAIVGAYRDDLTSQFQGSAYVFQRNGDDWFEIARLAASDAAEFDFFGYSVAFSGDTAIVGTVAEAAYVFLK